MSSELQRGELSFDFGECGFEGFAADGARGALVENAFALELKGLAFEGSGGPGGVGGILTELGVG